MSKSLGNTLGVSHLLQQVRPEVLRYYLVSAHYRSNLEFSATSLTEAAAAWERIDGLPAAGASSWSATSSHGPDAPAGLVVRRLRHGHGRRPRRCPRRWPPCTAWSARATPPWPPGERDAVAGTARSVLAMAARAGRRARRRTARATAGPPTALDALVARRARRPCRGPGRQGLGRPPTPSATGWPPPASSSRTPPTGHAGPCRGMPSQLAPRAPREETADGRQLEQARRGAARQEGRSGGQRRPAPQGAGGARADAQGRGPPLPPGQRPQAGAAEGRREGRARRQVAGRHAQGAPAASGRRRAGGPVRPAVPGRGPAAAVAPARARSTWPAGTPCSRRCVAGVPPPRCTCRTAWTPTPGSARPSGPPPTRGCPCCRSPRATWTG